MAKKDTTNFREKQRIFYDSHPKFSRTMDRLGDFLDKFMIVYLLFAIILIVTVMFISYNALPEEIRTVASGLVGTIFSLIVVPMFINAYNRNKENEFKQFEMNRLLYQELSTLIIYLICQNKYDVDDANRVAQFLSEHYDEMCVNFSSDLTKNIYLIYRECSNNNIDNVHYYCQKCIKEIRKESGRNKDFKFSPLIIEVINKSNSKQQNQKK